MSNSVREGWYIAKLYFHWIAAIPLNGSISRTLTDSANIKVTAFTAHRVSGRKSSTIIQEKWEWWKRSVRDEREDRETNCGNGGRDSRDDRGWPEGRYKSAIPESYLLASVIKIEYPNMEEGWRSVSADPPAGSFVIYIRDVRPAGAIVDIQ